MRGVLLDAETAQPVVDYSCTTMPSSTPTAGGAVWCHPDGPCLVVDTDTGSLLTSFSISWRAQQEQDTAVSMIALDASDRLVAAVSAWGEISVVQLAA